MQVVVVVRKRRERQSVSVERGSHAVALCAIERVSRDVTRHERAVARARPGRELERVKAVGAGPGSDVLERSLGHARCEEPQLHAGISIAATSTQRSSRADVSTASVMRAARSPSANVGSPSGREPVSIAAKTSATNRLKQS